MSATITTYPLDLVRARMAANKSDSVWKGVYHAYSTGGLYRGIGPTLVGIVPYAGISFFTYESLVIGIVKARKLNRESNLKKKLSETEFDEEMDKLQGKLHKDEDIGTVERLVCGATAGVSNSYTCIFIVFVFVFVFCLCVLLYYFIYIVLLSWTGNYTKANNRNYRTLDMRCCCWTKQSICTCLLCVLVVCSCCMCLLCVLIVCAYCVCLLCVLVVCACTHVLLYYIVLYYIVLYEFLLECIHACAVAHVQNNQKQNNGHKLHFFKCKTIQNHIPINIRARMCYCIPLYCMNFYLGACVYSLMCRSTCTK